MANELSKVVNPVETKGLLLMLLLVVTYIFILSRHCFVSMSYSICLIPGPSSVGLDFSFHGFEHAYGIPQHAETFLLKNTR